MLSKSVKPLVAVLALVAGFSLSTPCSAAPITWTHWTTGTSGAPGTAAGTLGGINVTYAGDIQYLDMGYPSWMPASSFTGGTVGNAPPAAFNAISLNGGPPTVTETLTFSQALVNPVFAIWSLGQSGLPTTFNFNNPFTIEAGGPSVEYGGMPITASGNVVQGIEGNGVIQFTGTFTSLSFTTPTFEHYYDFTIGEPSPVPEPSSLALLGTGLLGAVAAARRRLMKA